MSKIRDCLHTFWKALFEGQLFWRVTIFMTGCLLALIAVVAPSFGIANHHSDPALLILLVLIAALATFFIWSAGAASERSLDRAVGWFAMSELLFILGMLMLAVPITLIIRALKHQTERSRSNFSSSGREKRARRSTRR
jgi:hypothetical protein